MGKKKKTIPGSAIGLFICGGIMVILFIMSIAGIAIGGQNEMRIFFITAAVITAVMVITCLLLAQWMIQREASKHKRFASYTVIPLKFKSPMYVPFFNSIIQMAYQFHSIGFCNAPFSIS